MAQRATRGACGEDMGVKVAIPAGIVYIYMVDRL